jgi:hypothetical protein
MIDSGCREPVLDRNEILPAVQLEYAIPFQGNCHREHEGRANRRDDRADDFRDVVAEGRRDENTGNTDRERRHLPGQRVAVHVLRRALPVLP